MIFRYTLKIGAVDLGSHSSRQDCYNCAVHHNSVMLNNKLISLSTLKMSSVKKC